MEKKTHTVGTARALDRFLTLFVLLFALCTVYLCFRTYDETESLKKRITEAESTGTALNETIAEQERTIETLEEELAEIRSISDAIRNTKETYFSLLSDLEESVISGETDVKIAYLTFDDGPYLLSESFLDVLDDYDVPATFFYLMKSSETGYSDTDAVYDATYRRILSSGHTLGNHTASHKLGSEGIYRSCEAFMNDILRNRDFIYERYGYLTDVMRFPGGSYTSSLTDQLIGLLREEGYGYVDWDVSCGDGGAVLPPDQFRDNILYSTHDRKIIVVLMHDYSRNTLAALPEIIEGLSAQGYSFFPLFNGSVKCRKEPKYR